MFTLYYKQSCPYSQQVLGEAEALGIQLRLKDILSEESIKQDLVSLGGKKQTPFLIDDERGVKLYESNDIIAYLHEHGKDTEGEKRFGGLRVHQSPEVCDTCQ